MRPDLHVVACAPWRARARCVRGHGIGGLLGDVEQREQEDPDDVDEVPVDADVLDAVQLLVLARASRGDA